MKRVDRKTFLQMPEGTVFSKCEPKFLGVNEIGVLTDTGENDFNAVYLDSWADANATADLTSAWIEVIDEGKEIEMEMWDNRDGLYEKDETYFIFSKAEVQQMIALLNESLIKAYDNENN